MCGLVDIQEDKIRLEELEQEMLSPDFWADKVRAQNIIKEINELKEKLKGGNKYDKGGAIINIFAGAGGDDAEDWAAMLLKMYRRFGEKRKWDLEILHLHSNETGGVKNATFEIIGKNVYRVLKGESGVHRLVRISPFSAKKLRHTSFALVE